MAARKKTTTRKKPQYVRAKNRKGAESTTVARRSISIILFLLVILGILFGVKKGFDWIDTQLFADNPRFEIQHLVISCDGRLTEDYIREASGLREGMNLWELSFDDLEEKLLAVSNIESVYLERNLPNTLIVKVKERVPVARITGRRVSTYPFLVDRYGVVLPYRRSMASLPLIHGLDIKLLLGEPIKHNDVKTALKIIALCDHDSYLRSYIDLEKVDLQYMDYISLHLKGGARAKILRHSIQPRLYKLASTIKVSISKGQRVKTADVTLDSPKVPVVYY